MMVGVVKIVNIRMEGQLLAQKFVVPDVLKSYFNLVIDVHAKHWNDAEDWANAYSGGGYDKKNFIFAPSGSGYTDIWWKSRWMVQNILNRLPSPKILDDWEPASQTSPPYITLPIMQSGRKTFAYETYVREPYMGRFLHTFMDYVDATDKGEIRS
ncbi:MAG: hypothetical protein LBB45_07545 [Methanobrevibacter sp.]|nr:hypothetical protein [Candidatus Methanovirga basalitermitum]